ncbi:WD40-repeat-containing domain protein [Spinellus fusiger]|nr:WD40-repeat-containing domain protein [Spinellus fusiger]
MLKRRLSDSIPNSNSNNNNNKAVKLELTKDSPEEIITDTSRDEKQELIFANMRLRRIVKENHGSDIHQLSFFFNNKNFTAPVGIDHNKTFDKRGAVQRDQTDTSNVLATVGGCQLNVYDNEHCGDHLDIMSNFDLSALPTTSTKQDLSTFCWMYRQGDAWLATGGADSLIHIVSLANSQEIAVLSGHKKAIIDLQAHPHSDNYILSTSRDGTVRLWDVDAQRCLVVFCAEATVTCFHPLGTKFASGNARGEVREWQLPVLEDLYQDKEPVTIEKKQSKALKKMHGENYIDCIRYINGYLLSKSINGRIEYWDPQADKSIRSFRVKTGENFSRFDVSLDECFFCVGTSQGSVFIYNLNTGKMVTELAHRRSTKSVRCCAFSRDCR